MIRYYNNNELYRYIRSGDGDDSRESVLVKQVGNVTADTELTYEYGIKVRATPKPAPSDTSPKTKPKQDGNESSDEDEVKSKGMLEYTEILKYTEYKYTGIY